MRWLGLGQDRRWAIVLGCGVVLVSGCGGRRPAVADWTGMDRLVGDWGCEASFVTPQGPLTVPMVTQVRRGMSSRWLQIHREAPGWDRATGRFVEDEYTGWDRRRGQWVTTVANNFGVTGYLTSAGWTGATMNWDLHPFTDVSLPLRNRTTWRKISDNEWLVVMHTPANVGSTVLVSEHCLKRDTLNF